MNGRKLLQKRFEKNHHSYHGAFSASLSDIAKSIKILFQCSEISLTYINQYYLPGDIFDIKYLRYVRMLNLTVN